jgi:hypothetical protein
LATTVFLIIFAFYPNLRVLKVCSSWVALGVMQRTMAVREFPPSEDLRILVSGDFL